MYIQAYFYVLPFYHIVTIISVDCNVTVLWLLWHRNVPICATNKGILIQILF